MSTIKLKANDVDEPITVDVKVASCSSTINDMIDNLGHTEGKDDVVPLENVNYATLQKVIEWAEFHKDDPEPAEHDEIREKRTDDIGTWDTQFLQKLDKETLLDLILAANYLDVKALLDLCCKAIANMINGKEPEEIRKMFNLKNDFSKEEEEQVRRENEWCEEK